MSTPDDVSKGLYMDFRLAEVYIPMQVYGDTFDPNRALMYGTLFPDLYRPYSIRPNA